MDTARTCCFRGCRTLPQAIIEPVLLRLDRAVEDLLTGGVTTFISSGTPGFEQIAASLIVARKEQRRDLQLHFVLPCKDLDVFWDPGQKGFYRKLLAEADGITYIAEKFHRGCLKKLDRYVVDHSAYCICAYPHAAGLNGRAGRYARGRGMEVINVAARDQPDRYFFGRIAQE